MAWFPEHRVTVERVLSDNGSAYRSHACANLGITYKRTRPYRPQTNGKIERFHRTLADEQAYARFYNSEIERRTALPDGCTSTITTDSTARSPTSRPPAG